MGIEAYQLTSAIHGVVSQRLVRRKLTSGDYQGRLPVAEWAPMTSALRAAVLRRDDASAMRKIIEAQPGYVTIRESGRKLVEAGMTDDAEVRRVLGNEPGTADE